MIKKYLADRVRAALKHAGFDAQAVDIQFEKPKFEEHGDIATNVALLGAKAFRKNPRELAGIILSNLDTDPDIVSPPTIAGPGFINFRYAPAMLQKNAGRILEEKERYGRSAANAGKTVNVEWVSANPTGPLHAGHGRQVCLGATLCALLEWTGWTVTREYYFNNAGNQMNNLALSVRERYRELLGEPADAENIQYVGEYIRDIAAEIQREFGDRMRDEPLSFFRLRGEEWCFAVIKKTLERLGVRHDVFYNEDSLYTDGKIDQVVAELRALGLAYDSEGAVWLKTTSFGADKDRVIVKNTGEPTYRLPDIAYHREKLLRGYDRVIDIFGADHIATIPDVLAGVKALGLPTGHVDIVIHQMVSFSNEGETMRMSKRSGNVYYLNDLIEDAGVDAVRYFFVMRGANSHLEFDVGLAREQSENNPVYYLQYAHARIASIIRFAESEGFVAEVAPDLSLLAESSEIALMKELLDFPEVVSACAATYEVHHLCTYLHGMATAFHKFYHECRVVTDDRRLSSARIALCRAARQVLANGFAVLGISAPDRM